MPQTLTFPILIVQTGIDPTAPLSGNLTHFPSSPQLSASRPPKDGSSSSSSSPTGDGIDVWFALMERVVPAGGSRDRTKGSAKREEEATMAEAYK